MLVPVSLTILDRFGCAVTQAFYFVSYRKWAVRQGALSPAISALIAGFAGLAHICFFWVGFIIANYTGVEHFSLPSRDQASMLALGASITATGVCDSSVVHAVTLSRCAPTHTYTCTPHTCICTPHTCIYTPTHTRTRPHAHAPSPFSYMLSQPYIRPYACARHSDLCA